MYSLALSNIQKGNVQYLPSGFQVLLEKTPSIKVKER